MPSWSFDRRPLNDTCKLNMPKNWHLEVYKVKSGDSGEWYWCQILRSGEGRKTSPIVLCDCPSGKFSAPLVILGLKDVICKHGKALLEYVAHEEE